MTYWLRAVVQFVVLTFQSEQKFLQIISKWESCASMTTPSFSINNFLFLKLTSTNCITVCQGINELHFDVR